MTSRTLSSRLLLLEFKKKIPMYVIAFLVLMFAGPITLMMTINSYLTSSYMSYKECISNLVNYVQNYFLAGGILVAAMAVLFAFFCFGYVYSKSAVDMYHSLPIKREKLFLVKYLTGMVPAVLQILLSYGLSILVLLANGFWLERVSKAMLTSFLVALIGFFIVYHVVIIAIMLTGNLIIGVIGSGVLLSFSSMAESIVDSYYGFCFQTYYYIDEEKPLWLKLINPASIFAIASDGVSEHIFDLLAITVEAGAFLVIALLLYIGRPSECTNKPLCYSASKPIIRFPLVILSALTAGLFVSFEGHGLYEGWYWVAFCVISVLAHVAIDIIFEQDVKNGFKHPIQLVLCLGMGIVISTIFQYDLLGYDRYIPSSDEIASVSVAFHGIEDEVQLFKVEDIDGEDELIYMDMDREFFDHLVLDDETAIRNLAQEGIKQLNPNSSAIGRQKEMDQADNQLNYSDYVPMNNYVICYRLRSGRNVYRSYMATMESTYDDVASIYETDAYKGIKYQIQNYIDEEMLDKVEAYNGLDTIVFDEKTIDPMEFLDVYMSDLQVRTLDDLRDAKTLMRLSSTPGEFYDNILCGYYVLDTDENTLAFLEEHGISESDYAAKLNPDSVEEMVINNYDYTSNRGPEGTSLTAEDNRDKIEALCEVLVPSSFSYSNYQLHPFNDNVDVEVKYLTENNVQVSSYFRIPKDTPAELLNL